MASTSYKDAIHKIRSVNQEVDQEVMKVVKYDQKRSRVLFWLLIFFVVSSLSAFMVLVNQGIIKFYKEQVPTSILLVSAKANENGQVRIIIEVQEFNREVENPDFLKLKAHIIDGKSGTEYDSEAIPVFLENGSVQILVMEPNLVYLPGSCHLDLYLEGRQKKSNVVQVRSLEAM